MTIQELDLLLQNLLCYSVRLADKISTNLQIGNCDDSNKLILLVAYIDLLAFYNLEDLNLNCIDEDEFDIIVVKSKNICNLCDCN